MKKTISMLLAVVLLLGMLPVAALATGTQPEADSNGVYQIGTAEELRRRICTCFDIYSCIVFYWV